MEISIAANGNLYGNAKAKRMIGTLKREYRLDGGFPLEAQVRTALSEAVALYDWRRPHLALDYETPSAMYEKKAVREGTLEDTDRHTQTYQQRTRRSRPHTVKVCNPISGLAPFVHHVSRITFM